MSDFVCLAFLPLRLRFAQFAFIGCRRILQATTKISKHSKPLMQQGIDRFLLFFFIACSSFPFYSNDDSGLVVVCTCSVDSRSPPLDIVSVCQATSICLFNNQVQAPAKVQSSEQSQTRRTHLTFLFTFFLCFHLFFSFSILS